MVSLNILIPLLPFFAATTTAWSIQFSHEANCAAEDPAPIDPFTGDAGTTFPEQVLGPQNEQIEPVGWQSFTVEDWDDDCVIEFYDVMLPSEEEPIYVMLKDDRYTHEFGDDTVCVYDVPGSLAGGNGSWRYFRYLCE